MTSWLHSTKVTIYYDEVTYENEQILHKFKYALTRGEYNNKEQDLLNIARHNYIQFCKSNGFL